MKLNIQSGQILRVQIHPHFTGRLFSTSVTQKGYESYRMIRIIILTVEIRKSASRKAFFTHQQSAFPSSDHKTFWHDVGMTEFGTLKNGIQLGVFADFESNKHTELCFGSL